MKLAIDNIFNYLSLQHITCSILIVPGVRVREGRADPAAGPTGRGSRRYNVYIYVCMCMYVCIYIYIYVVYIYVYVYIYIYLSISLSLYIYIYIHTYISCERLRRFNARPRRPAPSLPRLRVGTG